MIIPFLKMVIYKGITLNLDKKMIGEIETLMNSKIQTEEGVIIFEVHVGNKQDFYRRLLRSGFNQINLEYVNQLKAMRIEYGDKGSSDTKNNKKA
jgi:hypothetical protein